MDKSFTATLFVIGIAVFFLVLIIMTVMMIVSKIKHRGDELFDDEAYDDDADGEVYVDEPYEASFDSAFETVTSSERFEQQYNSTADEDSEQAESEWEEETGQVEEIPSISYDTSAGMLTEDSAFVPETDSAYEPETDSAFAPETDSAFAPETDSAFAPETDSAFAPETDSAYEPDMTGDSFSSETLDDIDSVFADSAFADSAFADSAFAPEQDSAFAAADMTMLQKVGKKDLSSVVPKTDRFYWFNKTDVAAKPAYKTEEMYYHYFETPEECIEDLLTEMYDCALVRTEEIRYIAYGIEPVAVSMREILSVDKPHYILQEKRKEPSTHDLIKIYEKWCGYVEKLFGIIEFHADAYMVDQIHTLLCEFGKNDVDILITGM